MEYGHLIQNTIPPEYPLEVYNDLIDKINAVGALNPLTPEEVKTMYLLSSEIYYNNRKNKWTYKHPSNTMFVSSHNTPKIEEYIQKHNGTWIRKSRVTGGEFSLPNGDIYRIVSASDNARGHKPYKVIVDRDIDINILKNVVIPCCTHCCYFEVI